MKIEIKLDDPKYCNGCPCEHTPYDYGGNSECRNEQIFLNWEDLITKNGHNIRPQKCIDKYGA